MWLWEWLFCNGNFQQIKGRVFEVLASNSMLLEKENEATKKLFIPGVDYVEFSTQDDFIDKVKYYLSRPEEVKKIALSGHNSYNEKYTAKMFWTAILNKI